MKDDISIGFTFNELLSLHAAVVDSVDEKDMKRFLKKWIKKNDQFTPEQFFNDFVSARTKIVQTVERLNEVLEMAILNEVLEMAIKEKEVENGPTPSDD